jgi:hypothetical protein
MKTRIVPVEKLFGSPCIYNNLASIYIRIRQQGLGIISYRMSSKMPFVSNQGECKWAIWKRM